MGANMYPMKEVKNPNMNVNTVAIVLQVFLH